MKLLTRVDRGQIKIAISGLGCIDIVDIEKNCEKNCGFLKNISNFASRKLPVLVETM